jgi:hypothetical protein
MTICGVSIPPLGVYDVRKLDIWIGVADFVHLKRRVLRVLYISLSYPMYLNVLLALEVGANGVDRSGRTARSSLSRGPWCLPVPSHVVPPLSRVK